MWHVSVVTLCQILALSVAPFLDTTLGFFVDVCTLKCLGNRKLSI